jgi:L-alanine-DL-glutamate epimerase-like enolase superfamily enzyme
VTDSVTAVVVSRSQGRAGTLPRELAVVSYLRDHVAPLLIGRDPHRIEDSWQYLYRGAY